MTSKPRLTWISLLILAAAVGCGGDTYAVRMEETRRYFAYIEKLNQFLAPYWSGQSVELRVPKKFTPITPKAKPKGKKKPEDEEAADTDPRQPTYINLLLPGLQGAWQANLTVSGSPKPEKGYLYVVNNYELFRQKEKEKLEKAQDFNNEIVRLIAKAIEQPEPNTKKMPSFEVPTGSSSDAYVEKLKYNIVRPAWQVALGEKDYRIQIYCYHSSQHMPRSQTTIIYIFPVNTAASERMEAGIDLSLETLRITRDAPPSRTGTGGGAKGSPGAKAL